MAEDKNISAIDALKRSWEMMDGYKMKYFLLYLLLILLGIGGTLVLVIGLFFVLPNNIQHIGSFSYRIETRKGKCRVIDNNR